MEKVLGAARIPLATWPTPLDIATHPNFGTLLVKRDDLANFGGQRKSGVKARKLEGLLAHAKLRGFRRIIVPLGNITNLGFDLINAAQDCEIAVTLLIVDDPYVQRSDRENIFRPILRNVRLLGSSYLWAAIQIGATGVSNWLEGSSTMIVLPSPAHPSSVIAVARGYIEAMNQSINQTGVLPRSVYIASSSGATAAGMILGEALMRSAGAAAVHIFPVQVGQHPLKYWLSHLVRWSARSLQWDSVPTLSYSILRDSVNLIYGRFTKHHVDICARVLDQFGFAIDPIYGGKSWHSMECSEYQPGARDQRPVMFWHCGYTPNWQDYSTLSFK